MESKLNINQWAEEDRPREKLMQKGAEALSNAELLAILIGSGSREETAVSLMQRVLSDCNNSLRTLGRKSLDELTGEIKIKDKKTGKDKIVRRYKGLGAAKGVTLLAACELGRRRAQEEGNESHTIRSSTDLYRHFSRMQDLTHEECYALFMNQAYKIVHETLVSKGGLTDASVDIRVILREALVQRATVIALCHNHPSGATAPSRADDHLTDRLKQACQTINIFLLDHIIIGQNNFYSYREQGKL